MLEIYLTPAGSPAEQIRTQITDLIRSGQLTHGTKLPPIRSFAEHLRVAPGTVARAYRELEEAGLVESRPRHGTRVIGVGQADMEVARIAASFVSSAQRAGLSLDRTQAILTQLWDS